MLCGAVSAGYSPRFRPPDSGLRLLVISMQNRAETARHSIRFLVGLGCGCVWRYGPKMRSGRVEVGEFVGDGWSSGTVVVARTFLQRWRGLRPRTEGSGMVFRTRSVHGFGMKEPLLVIGLDAQGRVTQTRILRPRSGLFLTGARHILELPLDREPPPVDAVLTWVDAGSVDSLRHTDRQSR
jgi:uncharacterized membrane protein (UPF0127 family)